jgi:hypothetical protein
MNRKLLATILAGLMAATAIAYVLASLEDISEIGEEVATSMEMTLFLGSAAGYAIVSVWILKSKKSYSIKPYVATIAGSSFLIILYILSRTIDLPVVGLQDDIGAVDITSKVLQGVIIAISISMIQGVRKIKVISEISDKRDR